MATTFGLTAFFAVLIGGTMMLSTFKSSARESTSEALIFLVSFWIVLPIVLIIPFVISGMASSLLQGYFEAVSAITTTGASSFSASESPKSLLLYRAALEFFGGVISVTFIIVILAALNLSGSGVHLSKLFTLKRGELFERLIAVGRIVLVIYTSLALLCFIGLSVSGTGLFDALCLSLSAVSTGGMTPQDVPLARYVSPIGTLILALTCWLAACNAGVIWDLMRSGRRQKRNMISLVGNIEHRGMVTLLSVLVVIGVLYVGVAMAFPILVEAVFMITTAGFDYDVIGIDMLPPAMLICVALIGGSAISTAGGIKMIRMVLLLSHAGMELTRMSHPSRIKAVHYKGQKLPDSAFLSIWMYFMGYTILFGGGAIMLGAFGQDFPSAVASSAAALSNMGPLLGATFPEVSYAEMGKGQWLTLSGLMIFGRLEVLAGLAVLMPVFFRRQ